MKKSHKGLIAFICIVALIFIGYILYYLYSVGGAQNSQSNTQARVYLNKEYGYQLTLPSQWTVPIAANAYIDLYQKASPQIQNILSHGTSSPVTAEDRKALSVIDKEVAIEAKTWDYSTAQFVMLTNATLDEQKEFYNEVNNKQKVITDFFPTRTIRILPSNSIARLSDAPTSTPRKIVKIITLASGVQAEYKRLINPTIGATFVTVPMVSNKLTYDGEKINSLVISHDRDDISDEDFMSVVNSLVFVK